MKGIVEATDKLKQYIEAHQYKGYDPYDGLMTPLFRLQILRNNKKFKFYFQQFIKRFPINLRPLLLIPRSVNPVTLGLSIQAYSYLYKFDSSNKEKYLEIIESLINDLIKLIPKNYHGVCWGYNFDWEARYTSIPAYQPTVVATGIISNALFESYRITRLYSLKPLIINAADFVLNDLNKTYHHNDIFCFSYSPFDHQEVFNASAKGVRILAQAYALTNKKEYRIIAKNATQFIINHQLQNGGWYYSLASTGKWIDNYHTGYILDCLDEYRKHFNDNRFDKNIQKGYDFYRKSFITKNGEPKFYYNKIYPIDCTAGAQTILTTTNYNDIKTAKKVALFLIKIMQKPNGSFKFRKYKYYTYNTSFMRWSDAWMFSALTKLLINTK